MSELSEAPYAEYWPEVYRFAFLVAGGATAADQAIERTVEQVAGRMGQIRDRRQAKCWLFAQARDCCRRLLAASPAAASVTGAENAADGDTSSLRLARLFLTLPEQERTALALFYLYLFDSEELADLLEIKPAALGSLLLRAREMLQSHGEVCGELLAHAANRRQQLAPALPAADSAD